jgi:GNAT superfamily N-acetyltransferase
MAQIRNAHVNDLPALAAVRYHDRPAIHRDRVAASNPDTYQYLVAEIGQQIVGFGLLLLARPLDWADPLDSFPILIDLFVAESFRSQGVGKALIDYVEVVAQRHGKPALYLSVEPDANPRALQLYRRLGFVPIHEHPYHNTWRFTDSDGMLHEGEEWVIDMRKQLKSAEGDR